MGIPGASASEAASLSAYADDVTVWVRGMEDIQALADSLRAYEGAFTARVNWGKGKALVCGSWREGSLNRLLVGS